MEQLLEYLGERAEDFKKCFDIESKWCWKYADLVLRGMEKRVLGYAEGHHIVPVSFYGKRGCVKVDDRNLTVLTYGEHLWSHYCLVWCATGKMRGKMVRAFLVMYRIGRSRSSSLMPSEAELLDAIPQMELIRIRAMEPRWAKLDAEGRTHSYEDPKQYRKDYREANKEKIAEHKKATYEANREKILEQKKAYYEANMEKIIKRERARYEANREKILKQDKVYREANKEKIAESGKAYREANKEKIAKRKKAFREAHKEKFAKKDKAYYEANKEKIAKRKKASYEANKAEILERNKARYEANKAEILERNKAWRDANKEKVAAQKKAYREAKKAAGYRCCKNPLTGKREWVFVGLPEQEVAA